MLTQDFLEDLKFSVINREEPRVTSAYKAYLVDLQANLTQKSVQICSECMSFEYSVILMNKIKKLTL